MPVVKWGIGSAALAPAFTAVRDCFVPVSISCKLVLPRGILDSPIFPVLNL
jgi:hypothetical protein